MVKDLLSGLKVEKSKNEELQKLRLVKSLPPGTVITKESKVPVVEDLKVNFFIILDQVTFTITATRFSFQENVIVV